MLAGLTMIAGHERCCSLDFRGVINYESTTTGPNLHQQVQIYRMILIDTNFESKPSLRYLPFSWGINYCIGDTTKIN